MIFLMILLPGPLITKILEVDSKLYLKPNKAMTTFSAIELFLQLLIVWAAANFICALINKFTEIIK